jgi:spore coat polysaccharide biosynthesis protein SpsF
LATLGVVIQARIWAQRFPGKVLADLGGETVLRHIIRRCLTIPGAPKVYVATPDLALVPIIVSYGAIPYLGEEDNVLKRLVNCAQANRLDVVVRLTADCPFVDPRVIGSLVDLWRSDKYDYVSNVLKRTYPYGLDCEIVSTKVLENVLRQTTEKKYLEHVTLYIREHLGDYKTGNLADNVDYTRFDWRLDRKEDLPYLRKVYSKCGGNVLYPFIDMVRLHRKMNGYGSERLRVSTEFGGGAGGDSTSHVSDAVPADHPATQPGSPWYERGSGEPPPR